MIKRHFIIERSLGVAVLKKLLPEEIVSQCKFIVGGENNIAVTKARSILISSELPVSLVVDANTNHPESIEEKRDFIVQFIRLMVNPVRFQVFLAVPEIEILFFHKRSTLEKIVNNRVSDVQWITGKYEPRKVLRELFKTDDLEKVLDGRLTDDIIAELRENELIQMIIAETVLTDSE